MRLTAEETAEFFRLCDRLLNQEPTDEGAPVTRCRDCRFYGEKYGRCGIFGTDKAPEGYCDEAVKRRS